MKKLIAVACGVLMSCGSSANGGGPTPDAGTPDGGPSGGTADVVGRYRTICRLASGNTDLPVDLTQPQWTIRAWVPDGAGGYREVKGTGSADGSFVVHDVPVGATYLLQVGDTTVRNDELSNRYWVTDQRTIDLHSDAVTRCHPPAAPATTAIPVTVDLTTMSAFQAGDVLNLGSNALGTSFAVTSPGAGTTALHASLTLPQGTPLVDAAAGDDLLLNHTRVTQSTGTGTAVSGLSTSIIDQFDATGTTMTSGTPVAIAGAFRNLTPNRSGTMTADLSGIEADFDRTTYPGAIIATVTAAPPERVGGEPDNAVLWRFFSIGGVTRTGTTTFAYSFADPFPDAWTRTVTTSTDRGRSVKLSDLPDAAFSFGVQNQHTTTYRNAIIVDNAVKPPGGITVGGLDFTRGGAVAFDGKAPVVIHWNAVAGAQLYTIILSKVDAAADGHALYNDVNVTTADTSVSVPAGLIEAGARYLIFAEAIVSPINFRGGELLVSKPEASTGFPSARFRFLPSCGDGVVQAGEDCDTRGESATCNADCTRAVCGDGVVNAAAGEACDTVQASDTCNANCTL